MPWLNGLGTTTQLFKLPHPLKPDHFALRLSIATVSQGSPFSFFPGIDRQLSILEGEHGMELEFEDGSIHHRLIEPGKVLEFPGEVKVDCKLLGSGSIRDFNVMVARDWGRAKGPFFFL
ncbi:HutD-domain-containing protein, partial [Obelidium mucronatum]